MWASIAVHKNKSPANERTIGSKMFKYSAFKNPFGKTRVVPPPPMMIPPQTLIVTPLCKRGGHLID